MLSVSEVLSSEKSQDHELDEEVLSMEAGMPKEAESPYILVVEDNEDLNTFIVANLSKTFRVIKAFNGKEGFEAAQSLIPDLISTDVMMPDMDELALKVRNQIETSLRLRNKFRQEFISAPNEIDLQSPDDRLLSPAIEIMRENLSNPRGIIAAYQTENCRLTVSDRT